MKIIIPIIFIFFTPFCQANDSTTIKYLGLDQGLSNNAVTCIFQDHKGFMWFGTYDGLNRYDGYSFHVFRNVIGDSTSLSDNHIYKVEDDALNRIWIGTPKGVSMYDPQTDKFTLPNSINSRASQPNHLIDEVHTIRRIGSKILIGYQHNGLVIFEQDKVVGRQIQLELPKQLSTTNYSVTCIEYDKTRHVTWVFINGIGLCKYGLDNQKLVVVNSDLKQAICLFIRHDGNLLIGTDNGLYPFNREKLTYEPSLFPSRTKVTSVIEDNLTTLCIGSDGNGLFYMGKNDKYPVAYAEKNKVEINSNAIYALFQDRQNRKWIGTLRGGINILETRISAFQKISIDDQGKGPAASNFILSFCEDKDSSVWVGTDGGGLFLWNRSDNTFTKYTNNEMNGSISSNFITNINKDYRGNLWVATWFGGINRFDKRSKKFSHYPCYNPITKQDENNIWVLFEDSRKRLWASATNDGRLYQYKQQEDRFELFDQSLVNFQTLAEDNAGNIWGGNYTSLVKIDTAGKHHTVFPIGYPVRCIHEDRMHNFWVGTEGGGLLLFDRNKGTYQRITFKDGLPNNTVLRLLEDINGILWISTYNGLCKFNPSSRIFRNFSSTDGLQSNQFSFNAALALKSGEFLFGGINGFNLFHPDSVRDDISAPPIFLTGLRINNKAIEDDNVYVRDRKDGSVYFIEVPFDKSMLSMDFMGLDYTNANKLKYAWYLKGWDKEWTSSTNNRVANYSRLQEGQYQFFVKVMNADGFWGEPYLLLNIKILPPWYRTWVAYLIYIAFAVLILYLYLQYNKRQERLRYEIKLVQFENEKEKEIAEKRAAFFTHISHEFRTPLTLIINPLKELLVDKESGSVHKKLAMIQRNAKRLLSLVDQLLLYRKVDSIDEQLRIERFSITNTCNDIILSFGQLSESNRINLCYEKPSSDILICGDREKIEIILFNLVSNALKFTPVSGTVLLEVVENDTDVEISVKDTGPGISEHIGEKLFDQFYQANNINNNSPKGFGIGLYVSRLLAVAHKGRLFYTSRIGEGCRFTLQLLKGNKHFKTDNVHTVDKVSSHSILQELIEEPINDQEKSFGENSSAIIDKIKSGLPKMVIADDNQEMRECLKGIFKDKFSIFEAENGNAAYQIISKEIPEIIISDVMMNPVSGNELCQNVKKNDQLAHIPIILLTASSSEEAKLKGIENGAEDYITKPFDRDLITARVQNILISRSRIQQYFFNSVTLRPFAGIADEHKAFIERCIEVVENHLDNPEFTIPIFCREIGMSHPTLYKKIKAVSGLTVNVFIRYLRLRKAAEILITTNKKTAEVAYITGFNDVKYFREQFLKLFGMKPAEFIQKFRKISER